MPSVTDSITVRATPAKVFGTIVSFEDYPKIFPEVKSVKVLKRNDDSAEVAFVMDLIIKINLELRFDLKDRNKVAWSMIKGDNIRKNEGYWEISKTANGMTRVVYFTETEFGWLVPGSVAKVLIEDHLPKMLKNLKSWVER